MYPASCFRVNASSGAPGGCRRVQGRHEGIPVIVLCLEQRVLLEAGLVLRVRPDPRIRLSDPARTDEAPPGQDIPIALAPSTASQSKGNIARLRPVHMPPCPLSRVPAHHQSGALLGGVLLVKLVRTPLVDQCR